MEGDKLEGDWASVRDPRTVKRPTVTRLETRLDDFKAFI
jgi:hypothetical protein